MFPTISTQRLLIRALDMGDLRAFLAYRNDPEVARYQSWNSIAEDGARHYLAECMASEPGVPGQWYQVGIALRETGELIGDMGLGINAQRPTEGEIGYTLSRACWGQGYGSEAVSALLDYAFTYLGLTRIKAVCDTRNEASFRLMEKIGMRRVGMERNVLFKGEYCDEYEYAIGRAEWEELRGLSGASAR
jgi:RimJ/RimL family protein N-acetyltransferase